MNSRSGVRSPNRPATVLSVALSGSRLWSIDEYPNRVSLTSEVE